MLSKNRTVPDAGQVPPEPNVAAVEKYWASPLASLDAKYTLAMAILELSKRLSLSFEGEFFRNGIQYL